MKKNILFTFSAALLLLSLISSCNKEKLQYTSIHVLETSSNLPVSGATVVLFRCNYGCPFGSKILFNGITNNDGISEVLSEDYNDVTTEMNVMKLKYWPFLVQKNTTVFITPEGWLQLRIKKIGNYPVGSVLKLNVKDLSGTRADLTYNNAAPDSLIYVRAYGGQQNKIDWYIEDRNFNLLNYGTLSALQIPRFDTLKNITLSY